jgi:hypothetical protein
MEMCEEHCCNERRRASSTDETHNHTATSVNNNVLSTGLDK